MAALSASIGFTGFSGAGYSVNYLDLSPHYVGIFFSIGNTIGNISGVIAPIVAGQILQAGKSSGGGGCGANGPGRARDAVGGRARGRGGHLA